MELTDQRDGYDSVFSDGEDDMEVVGDYNLNNMDSTDENVAGDYNLNDMDSSDGFDSNFRTANSGVGVPKIAKDLSKATHVYKGSKGTLLPVANSWVTGRFIPILWLVENWRKDGNENTSIDKLLPDKYDTTQCFDTHKERLKASKNDDSVVSSVTASNSIIYVANLSNEEVNNILDKKGVILQEDDSSDELEIEKEDIIHIQTIEKLPSPWNMDKLAARLKNKKVEVTMRTTKSKKPFKACFKCGQEGYLIKHCKEVDETSLSSLKRHGLEMLKKHPRLRWLGFHCLTDLLMRTKFLQG
ncbi:hypothetical protein L1987_08835 [Smallanthus sonchifolius]|uniref:Uncharacterized protein n=1 Tax=Smallanthus sonchifolius TaxID=185202 RepID=A0ACB9JM96_9ASTR|nr:hypothetical protein L1987_08835 [Smallanthus sonchifolius]